MKILLSAFNCQPGVGSEEGRGWCWVNQLALMRHEIWVITCSNNQPEIEKELQKNPKHNLHFIYCKKANWLPWAYQLSNAIHSPLGAKIISQTAKTWWQWDAYQIAKSLTQEVKFDLVHHVTNTTIRRPSFMGLLKIPFILGPLAGGVKTPKYLTKSYPLIGKLSDFLRDLANTWIRFDPLMHLTLNNAIKIYCDSEQTQMLLPKIYRFKSEVLFSMPTREITTIPQVIEPDSREKEIFRVLYVGRFLYWKGLHLALKAFAQLYQKNFNASFTLIGKGQQQAWLQGYAKQLNIEEAIDWKPWMEWKQLSSAYLQHDVLLFPSLHDMGGNVVLESLNHGLPVVCLDLGGPGVMVDDTCGRVIGTDGLSEETVVFGLSNALVELAENLELRHRLSKGALIRATQFSFKNILNYIYSEIDVIKEIKKYEKSN